MRTLDPYHRETALNFAYAIVTYLLLTQCSACGLDDPLYPMPALGLTVEQQRASAVTVEHVCTWTRPQGRQETTRHGSGAVVGSDAVLTARHVIDAECRSLETLTLRVVYASGSSAAATVQWIDANHDLAVLQVAGAEPAGAIVQTEPAGRLCAETAWPRRERRCGELTGRALRVNANGETDMQVATAVTPGNSGSAIWDGHGRLVGVLTNTVPCGGDRAGESCGALASSVVGRLP